VLPARSLNLNAYAKRWIRSVKEEWLTLRGLVTYKVKVDQVVVRWRSGPAGRPGLGRHNSPSSLPFQFLT
jgi:hypothetical protein